MRRQRGIALITVLLVFALVAVIATEMLHRSQLNLRSVGGLVESRQAYYYALAGEAYARQLLARDIVERNSTTDTLIEPWAQTKDQQPFPIDNGKLQIEIYDLQGRFNLNNVVDAQGLVQVDGVAQFRRLLQALQLNRELRERMDRLDRSRSNPLTQWRGGCRLFRLSHCRGARRADISALRLLHSMKPEDYAKLAPHVTVLPIDGSNDKC